MWSGGHSTDGMERARDSTLNVAKPSAAAAARDKFDTATIPFFGYMIVRGADDKRMITCCLSECTSNAECASCAIPISVIRNFGWPHKKGALFGDDCAFRKNLDVIFGRL